jgi:D-alanyl-D-alanine carboxypeptidase/D-alanyl-D-alanine-endopeptidase (penicillin-binding protein 4)
MVEMPIVFAFTDWQQAQVFAIPTEEDPQVEKIVNQYLRDLQKNGYNIDQQEIWIRSQWAELVNIKSDIPIAAASLTKIATTLAAVNKLDLDHRFVTEIGRTGEVINGVLKGDLVITGGGDPLFTWEEGVALANKLEQLGIKKIQGNLVILNNFSMNFQKKPQASAEALKKSFNYHLWPAHLLKQEQKLVKTKPTLTIQGKIILAEQPPAKIAPILRHQSLSLKDIIKQMNIYSNNHIAQSLADSIGGATTVVQTAIELAQVSPEQIHLENGSGLGVNNRISPKAITQIWMTLENLLAKRSSKITDLFPVSGVDHQGTLQLRHIPAGVTLKTGTLNEVSALAGVIPTKERGLVWFAILNHGSGINQLRHQQDILLQKLSKHWQFEIDPNKLKSVKPFLGDPSRNSLM